ncbi:MAG: hypothetical protein IKG00_02110 [Lachnospiraceae bacterium]|nr:hypothetical protein [Lachnospiraceae bacterium]
MKDTKKAVNVQALDDDKIEQVTGGTEAECAEIVAVFRKHGFHKEAKRLNGRVYSLEWALRDVLKEMGYPGMLEVYATDERENTNFLHGNHANHRQIIEALDDFLYKKANNITEEI